MGPEVIPYIVFPVGTTGPATVDCATLTVFGDRLVEEDEEFSIEFETIHPLDELQPSETEVTIVDDDGMKLKV